jgi:hypothetical protein
VSAARDEQGEQGAERDGQPLDVPHKAPSFHPRSRASVGRAANSSLSQC